MPILPALHPVDPVHVLVRIRIIGWKWRSIRWLGVVITAARVHVGAQAGNCPAWIARRLHHDLVHFSVSVLAIVVALFEQTMLAARAKQERDAANPETQSDNG